jgi:dephospho-CoA kinase
MAFEFAVVLTGGIATGKSTVAKIFDTFGFKIIDADKVAHEMLELHQDKIVTLFGLQYIVNGKVDRKALGGLIFGDKKEKERLESLLHPLIFSEIEKQSVSLDLLKKPYLVDIPLFFETERYPIKKSIVVYVPQRLQLERLMERDCSSKEASLQRINAQMEIDKKKQKATYLIDNQGDLNALQQHCVKVKEKILEDYKGK